MSGIHPHIVFSIVRISFTFADSLGNRREGSGTAFWVQHNNARVLVTNRHNLDPSLKHPSDELSLARLQVEIRRFRESVALVETRFFEVCDPRRSLFFDDSGADLCILVAPSFAEELEDFSTMAVTMEDIADAPWLSQQMQIMDAASFIGFPGIGGQQWWDTRMNLPIARACTVASHGKHPFTNPAIKTSNVALVSGLSFSGSSGSPVILHERGIAAGPGLEGGSYRAPKIVGIMSGHFDEKDLSPAMFKHSGLSYFTRSDSIRRLIAAYDADRGSDADE